MPNAMDNDRPSVRIHPPTALIAAIAVGYLLRLWRGGLMPLPAAVSEGIGCLLIIIAVMILFRATTVFATAGEQLPPATPSETLLTEFPYTLSRNPIYLGMVMFACGLGFATQNLWMLLTAAVFAYGIHSLVILPEEDYLARRFGAEYSAYKARVRRWL